MLLALPFGMQLLTAALMAVELMLYFSLHFGYVQRFARRSVRLIAPIAPPVPGSLDGFEITPMGPGRWLIRRAHGLTRRLPFFALLTSSPGPVRLQYGVGPVSLYAFPALVIPAFGLGVGQSLPATGAAVVVGALLCAVWSAVLRVVGARALRDLLLELGTTLLEDSEEQAAAVEAKNKANSTSSSPR